MIASALFILVSIGGVIGAFLVKEWWIFLIPLGILIIFLAPYKLWRNERDKLNEYERKLKPKLATFIEPNPVPGGDLPEGQERS